jgi:hypothetical protein
VVLSQRERYIAVALGGVLALVVLWQVVYGPLDSWSRSISDQKQKAETQKFEDERLRKDQARLTKVWDEMQKTGIHDNPSEAQNQLSQALSDWAVQSGVNVVRDAPQQAQTVDAKFGFVQAGRQLTCFGTTSGIAKLLYQIEMAKIPSRVHNVTISSKKEGQDDLTAVVDVTTLCVVPVKPGPGNQPAAGATPTAMKDQ